MADLESPERGDDLAGIPRAQVKRPRGVVEHPGDRWELVRFLVPPDLARYVVEKGSIAVDGVSLTVAGVEDGVEVDGQKGSLVTVSLIPETLTRTTLGRRAPGELVNLEVDVLAKYVERLLDRRDS